ncbi:MAG TPA: HlyC/CorC family transporter [Crocinitomicaceae bacterium]|nr:HlyC/CorC family transporter [Crocinitomicaceae bacterium]
MEVPLIGIILTLIFSAFFSSMEIAFISSNRLKVELDKSSGSFNGKILGLFYKNEARFIAMLLLGNNIALVLFGLFSAKLLEPVIHSWGIINEGSVLLIQTILSTVLVLIVAEFLPKTFVQMNPNGYLRYVTYPMMVIYVLLIIPTFFVLWLSNIFLKLLKVDSQNTKKVFSKIDLEHYVQDINERIKEEQELGNEMQILQNALDFDSVKARDCMVPRTEIISVDIEDDIYQLQDKFVSTGKSKIIVYRDSIDNIIGYVHSFEMFKSPKTIKQILLPVPFVPEAIPGKELLELFSKKSGNLAIVVDEYGGTAGIITIEDVIEEIFGEIEDEHDNEELLEEKISDKEFRFSARIDIDYLVDEYELKIDLGEEYETLGGFVIHQLEEIPKAGTELEVNEIKFLVEEVSDTRIEIIRITLS